MFEVGDVIEHLPGNSSGFTMHQQVMFTNNSANKNTFRAGFLKAGLQ